MEIKIQNIVGDNCITREDGQKVYELIFPLLQRKDVVTLDFNNIGVFTSPFLNSAIGPLFKDFSREELREQLLFVNINSVGKSLMKIVIENSSRYYSDEKFRKVHDDILSENEDDGEEN
ncbi:STAS-like domain-containing protein [Paenibacillus algicola]|uniref:STAS-like domain-containing protein n=1 Tax=Paenibacillus algicola TaxID=2565926 RepID=UPI0010FCDDA0|nr:STAS-like domain-containing protein [Paenibacillus algicola]